MSGSDGGIKPPLTGLVDMGNTHFYNDPGTLPPFNISDLADYAGSFSAIVLNVTWAELQPTANGPLDTAPIDGAIAAVNAYNAQYGTDVGIELRVWGGYTAPEWAKTIDGPPVTVMGPVPGNPNSEQPETVGRFWTADYITAWTGFLTALGADYNANPTIVAISNSTGAAHTDEPFSANPSQFPALQAAGYTDAAEALTLRASVADYSGWDSTPLEYPTNPFHLDDSGTLLSDPVFTLAVLQEAQNSSRVVQVGNHALTNPLSSSDAFIFAQMAADAALDPATAPGSDQTADPANLGSYANWPATIRDGVAAGAGAIELWDAPGNSGFTSESPSAIAALAAAVANGVAPFTGAPDDGRPLQFIAPSVVTGPPGTIALSATDAVLLASATGAASYTVSVTSADGDPLTLSENGAPVGGTTLTFSGSLATVNTILASLTDHVTSGTDTLSITAADSAGNSVTSLVGVIATAGSAGNPGTSGGTAPASGGEPAGPPATYLWSGSGTNDLFANAADWSPESGPPGAGDTALFTASPAPITLGGSGAVATLIDDGMLVLDGGSAIAVGQGGAGALEIADQAGTTGTLVVAGVDTTLTIAGNLDLGGTSSSAGGVGTLLAALTPNAYSTASSLAIAGTLQVWGEGAVRMSGALSAAAVAIASGGIVSGDGTLAASGGTAIVNDGTIEAVADRTLGLQELAVAAPVAGTGEMAIDPGAELTLEGAVGTDQTIVFAAPSQAQLSDGPYSPTTLMLADPAAFAGTITGFSFAASLVLAGVDASAATYVSSATGASGVLSVDPAGGGSPLSLALSGSLAGLVPVVAVSGSGSAATTTITFVPATGGQAPPVAAPASLQGAAGIAVAVPDIVLETPISASAAAGTAVEVTITAGSGTLAAGTDNGATTLSRPNPQTLILAGTLNAVEQSLGTLTYAAAATGTDIITIAVSAGGATSAPTGITVTNGAAGADYAWQSPNGGSFADASRWTTNGYPAATAPGGADIAAFGAGAYAVTGDGAAGEISVAGTLTLTGRIEAQGLPGTGIALDVDGGGALTLAGGAVLAAAGTVAVGASGNGALTVMGGALTVSNDATDALVIGENAGSSGTVLDLEQVAVGGSVMVGDSGRGTLELLGVAAGASSQGADIGVAAGGSGTVIVNGGEWTTSGYLTVGDAGTGSVLIDGAANGITGQAIALSATIGHQAGSTGTVSLAGGDLLVANASAASSTLKVGGGGTGILSVTDDGNVTVGVAMATVNGSTVLDNGSLIVGVVAGGAGFIVIGSGSAIEVDGGATVGQAGRGSVSVGQSATDTGLFAMTGTLAIGAAGAVTLGGPGATVRASAVTIAPGGSLEGSGTLSGDGGATVMLAGIANDGTIEASGGPLLIYGSLSGTGTLTAGAGASLTLQAAVGSGQTLLFGPGAVTTLNDVGAFAGTIDGFAVGDAIDIGSLPYSGSGSAILRPNNLLTITEGNQTYHLQFDPTQNFSDDIFQLAPDGSWGTTLTMVDPPSSATITESAADVSAGLDQLQSLAQSGEINGIVLTDPATPTITVQASQFASDPAALRFIDSTFNIAVPNSGLQDASAALQSLNPGTSTVVDEVAFVDGTMTYGNSDPAAQIDRLYQTVLDRPPDPDGLASWTGQLESGTPLLDIANSFLASPEYQTNFAPTAANPTSFVTQLYEHGLDRAPDPGGLSYWVGQLTSGQMSEAQVVLGISQSNESIGDSAPSLAAGVWVPNEDAAAVARLYYSALDRAPDLGGLEYWTGLLQSGTDSLTQLAGDFLDSAEFLGRYGTPSNSGFVNLMYQNGLERAPDPAGGAYWLGELNSGAMTEAGVLLGISQSPESVALRTPVIEQHGIAFYNG